MNYKLIGDEDLLRSFLDSMPELEKHEKYYFVLLGRKKYFPGIGQNGHVKLGAFTAFNTDDAVNRIKRLQVEEGLYTFKSQPLPNVALVLYMKLNPRNMKEAAFETGMEIIRMSRDTEQKSYLNIEYKPQSVIQSQRSRRVFADIDIDTKDIDLSKLKDIFRQYDLIETQGGYHVIIKLKENTKVDWHNKLIHSGIPFEKISSDDICPVPGTIQNNFIVNKLI